MKDSRRKAGLLRLTVLPLSAGMVAAAFACDVLAAEGEKPHDIGGISAGLDENSPVTSGYAMQYRRIFRDAIAAGQYQEAELAAKQRIEFLLSPGMTNASDMAGALTDLALVQRLSHQLDASLQNYDAVIDLLQREDDMLSRRLISPLAGQAIVYREAGDYAQALRTYDRALHISHVNEGPHTIEQVHILQGMLDTQLAAGDVDAAFDLLDRMTVLYERRYSPYALEVLPVLHQRAALLNTQNRHREERHVYRRIARIQAENYGPADLALVDTYLALGRTYLHEADEVVFRSEPTTRNGESYFQRALAVVESNPAPEPEDLAECLLALGDYYTVMNSIDLSRLQYARAWQVLSDANRPDLRQELMERAVPLRRLALSRYPDFNYGWSRADVDPSELVEGHITAGFRVNDRGRVRDIELIESDPAGFEQMETRVRFGVKEFIYRPAYRDGEPVESDDVVYRHDFYYRQSDVSND